MVEYQDSSDLFLFVANLHSLTSLKDGQKLKAMTQEAVLDLLALGIDPEKSHFWIQSDVPEVTELAWILSCLAPMGMMEKATSYKDKVAKGIKANLGLFNYPVLQAADILIHQAEGVPVGKDQKQHLEMTRDLATKFNAVYGETFVIPEPEIQESVAVVPGNDGQKMSKSYNNFIPIFDEPKVIKKAVMSIVTDSKGVDEPKDPETCNVFQIYKLFLDTQERVALTERYRQGGMGYGEVKKMLLEVITDYFAPFQEKRDYYAERPEVVKQLLKEGAEKVRCVSLETMDKVRVAVGL